MQTTRNSSATWLTAYIDESGNHDLETSKSGASNLFVCVAVLLDGNQDQLVERKMQSVSNDFFSGSEVKSSGIRSKHNRRIEILEEVCKTHFGYYALVINKSQIFKESGLKHKRSFYKFLNNMLYARLLRSGVNLRIVADEIGGKQFMDSFLPYLKKKGKPDLFTDYTHRFASSKLTPQVQLADLIAGTLAWCFDESKGSAPTKQFRDLLKPKEIGIASWPQHYTGFVGVLDDGEENERDAHVQECSINRAYRFIDEYEEDPDDKRRMQVSALRQLVHLRVLEEETPAGTIISDRLIHHLKREGFDIASRHQLSSQVIGPLRDCGILIAGGSDGYRLVCTVSDINRYLLHNACIMGPMISRLRTARESVKHDTANQYDILDADEFTLLRTIVESASEQELKKAVMAKSDDSAEFNYDIFSDSQQEIAYVAEEQE